MFVRSLHSITIKTAVAAVKAGARGEGAMRRKTACGHGTCAASGSCLHWFISLPIGAAWRPARTATLRALKLMAYTVGLIRASARHMRRGGTKALQRPLTNKATRKQGSGWKNSSNVPKLRGKGKGKPQNTARVGGYAVLISCVQRAAWGGALGCRQAALAGEPLGRGARDLLGPRFGQRVHAVGTHVLGRADCWLIADC